MSSELSPNGVYVGIDIGSVNTRIAVVTQSGELTHVDSQRNYNGSAASVSTLLQKFSEKFPLENIAGGGVTGSGRHSYDEQSGWQSVTSPYAAITGLEWDGCKPRTIIAIGGQSSLVIGLDEQEDGKKKISWRVARSPLCAAGTGRFLEQQASRLGITIEEFGPKALTWTETPPRVAARCSVFAKSDLIHLQQKGWPIPAMLAGLSDSVAHMIQAQWRDEFTRPVYCIGGVAANDGVMRALSNALGNEPVKVPPEYAYREAIGAAMIARINPKRPVQLQPRETNDSEVFYVARILTHVVTSDGWQPWEFRKGKLIDAYLGVDVGSTSTKAAVIDSSGEVLAKTYLMTAGQPLEAIKQVMGNLAPQVEGKVRVIASGVTGSGRYLVGSFIGADVIKNEITAQTRAALQYDPDINTVFELGGQDSKFVYLENGVSLAYQMNKACAAGTGSFIDELAEQLGISTRSGEFARLAFAADCQLDLGEKCTAFMSQAVTSAQQAGVSREVIVSSLATSLVKNYLSKVVGTHHIGDRIFLTGAVFYNEAVVGAFQTELPDKEFIVPEHKEVTGAIGAALLAKEAMSDQGESQFKGFSRLAEASYKLTNFNCHQCENTCAISMMISDKGKKLFYGSRCDLYDAGGSKKKGESETPFTILRRLRGVSNA